MRNTRDNVSSGIRLCVVPLKADLDSMSVCTHTEFDSLSLASHSRRVLPLTC